MFTDLAYSPLPTSFWRRLSTLRASLAAVSSSPMWRTRWPSRHW